MIFQSGNFSLDTQSYIFERGGAAHSVEPQVFDLLIYLIENRNRVVSRNELFDNLWKGRIVTDSALNARLKVARKAVGDDGKKQGVIKTIHRRGYQFIGPVTEVDTQEKATEQIEPRHSKTSHFSNYSPSIAVLQFANLSNDPKQQYFTDGITTNICSRLSRIRSLQVKSGVKYNISKTALPQIARELNVDYLLCGSVQREGDRVRVFVELTDGGSGEIKWSEYFDRHGKAVIDVQDDIAIAITGTLWSNRGTILEAERDKLAKKLTCDFNAFDYILKGIYYKEKYSSEELVLAHECFDKAIELDPDCAEAYGWNAWVFLLEILLGSTDDSTESLKQACSAARIAIDKDAYSEIGHWALGEAFIMDQDTSRGLVEIEKALEINPNNPDLMVSKGSELCILGRYEEGIELIHQGINFNKHHPEWYFWHLGIAHFAGHRLEDAILAFIRMDNQNKDTLTYLVACYAQIGDLAEAEKLMLELLSIDPATSPEEIVQTHSYLAAGALELLVDGFKLVMDKSTPRETLRVI